MKNREVVIRRLTILLVFFAEFTSRWNIERFSHLTLSNSLLPAPFTISLALWRTLSEVARCTATHITLQDNLVHTTFRSTMTSRRPQCWSLASRLLQISQTVTAHFYLFRQSLNLIWRCRLNHSLSIG